VQNAARTPQLFVKSALFYFLYYVGYELCFRGFLFMGIKDDVGEFPAVLISLAMTVLLHVTQPQLETLLAVIAGFVFPLVVLRLKTIWPVVLIHAYVGISLNYWIIVRQGGFIG
jgi:membrane protease YdiL (CAAX protease family)